ncbi:3-isopropylmalate dehydratase [Tulasnella sp. JGI-2019a]|nr:3-isopropylmalate dehydratase [Tulasnella sp. JGI-2019a]
MQKKSKNMRISVNGTLPESVTSKDVILYIIGQVGTAGGTGCVIEYTGNVVREMSMEARMSVCNMSIEAGARAGMVGPDDITFEYLRGRPLSPKGEEWDKGVAYWKSLRSDEGAKFDIDVTIRAEDIVPTVTWGTSPQDVAPITGNVPDPTKVADSIKRAAMERSLQYMGLEANTPMEEISVDKVFLGSCTNGRIEDLRAAAKVVMAFPAGSRVANNVKSAMIVPGSGLVKQQAEAEGLDAIFTRAGFEWREAGCSMCLGMNPDQLSPKERCASTSNRNFEGRQGAGGRTHLVSPAMAAAAAMTGHLTDVRKYTDKSPASALDGLTKSVAQMKLTNALDYLTDTVLPSPAPQPLGDNTSAKSGPPNESNAAGAAHPSLQPAVPTPVALNQFTVLSGIAAPLSIPNCDTDMIIPKQFLKTLKRTGLGAALFYTLRKDPSTGADTDFVLNRSPYDHAKILVCTGENFGCGSSREHAPWSLKDFGINAVIAPSFGEIFKTNSMQNGVLPVVIPQEACKELYEDASQGLELTVDLEKLEVRRSRKDGGEQPPPIRFDVEPFRRDCLLNGLDDIALTLKNEGDITQFEEKRSELWPWLDGFGYQKSGRIDAKIARKKAKVDW